MGCRIIFLGLPRFRPAGFGFGQRALGCGRQRATRRHRIRAFCLRLVRHIRLHIIHCETAVQTHRFNHRPASYINRVTILTFGIFACHPCVFVAACPPFPALVVQYSMKPSRFVPPTEVPGLAARRIAADIIDGVLHNRRTLDDQLEGPAAHPILKTLSDRDRALMRRLVATVLRRLGTLGHLLSRLLDRGIPTDAPRAQSALLIGAAQILWKDVPDHAAVDLSVRLVQADRRAAKYAGLVNAVLRRCAREGLPLVEEVKDGMIDLPPWLVARWIKIYDEDNARAMALALGHEPPLDLTVKTESAS